jgi:hypothetical protein
MPHQYGAYRPVVVQIFKGFMLETIINILIIKLKMSLLVCVAGGTVFAF